MVGKLQKPMKHRIYSYQKQAIIILKKQKQDRQPVYIKFYWFFYCEFNFFILYSKFNTFIFSKVFYYSCLHFISLKTDILKRK